MWLSIPILLALMMPVQNSSNGVPDTPGFGAAGREAKDSYQLGPQRVALFQQLSRRDDFQAKPLFVRPAQESAQTQTPTQLHLLPMSTLLQLQERKRQERHLQDLLERRAREGLLFPSNMCLALRVYHFERNDGKAPVLVNTVTCTPMSTVFPRKVRPSQRGLYVPLNLNY